ncbi:MAG: hypothetical protein KKC75_01725 [Nanoarchaeota archaeon]|nr:hypothetical protein [Nanoarchaeota archaeon]MBU1005338.1 hypothetical protein [Nanoarchaeota archaeon]MBU1946236.1 hypothetical protein [Nanoarchaeota archaeon]
MADQTTAQPSVDPVITGILQELSGKTTPEERHTATETVHARLLQLHTTTDVHPHLLAMLTQSDYTPEQLGFSRINFGGVDVVSYYLGADIIQFDALPNRGYRPLKPTYPT